jgi:hypothetical protein
MVGVKRPAATLGAHLALCTIHSCIMIRGMNVTFLKTISVL